MKNFFTAIALVIVSVCIVQGQETRGTDVVSDGLRFVVAFPKVWASPTEKPLSAAMQILVFSEHNTTVIIRSIASSNAAPRIDRTLAVEANKALLVFVSTSYMNIEPGRIEGFGIEVVSDKPIFVSTRQSWQGNGELTMHLPVNVWGTKYRTMNLYQDRYGASQGYKYRPAQVVLIADSTPTTIQIQSKVALEVKEDLKLTSNPKPDEFNYTTSLEKGETLLLCPTIVEALTKDWASDPSGMLISSSAPIAVISGHCKGAVMRYPEVLPPTGQYAAESHFVRNNIHESMLPDELAGTEFVGANFMYTPTRVTGMGSEQYGIDDDRGDVIRIVALQDDTKVYKLKLDGTSEELVSTLNSGQSHRDTVVENNFVYRTTRPAHCGHYGKSYAKVLPPSIEKEGDEVQGHPTIEAGMPSLSVVPPTNRWGNHGLFYSADGMDNFLTIVFTSTDLANITLDNEPLTRFAGTFRLIQGTNYAYIRTPVAAGNHVLKSNSSTIKFYAQTYGSLDGLQQGRAYSSTVAMDYFIPCDDSIAVTDTMTCDGVAGLTKVLSATRGCGELYYQFAQSLTNMSFVAKPAIGPSECGWSLRLIDSTMNGTATIRFVSRSGKWVERMYDLSGVSIAVSNNSVNFGYIPLNTPACTTIVVKNLGGTTLVLNDLHISGNVSLYSISPTSLTIPPGDSQSVEVCVIHTSTEPTTDSLVADIGCFEKTITRFTSRAAEPAMYCTDQTWRVPYGDKWYRKELSIQNVSQVNVLVTAYTGPSTNHFRIDSGLTGLPISIQPTATHTFWVSYNPFGTTNEMQEDSVVFISNASGVDAKSFLNGIADNSTSVEELHHKNIKLIPNPVSLSQHNSVKISGLNDGASIIVYNSLGEIIYSGPTDVKQTIPANVMQPGLFVVRLSKAGQDMLMPLVCIE